MWISANLYLRQLGQLCEHHSVGLYRDESLVILKGLWGPEPERVKKKVIKVLKDRGLKMILKTNLHLMKFSDITELLCNNTNELHKRPKNHPVYLKKTVTIQK